MEERPISSRMQELLQRATDERQAEQHRQGESVESLRSRVDELSTSIEAGNERLTEKIDATFTLAKSTVDILQRLADRVDALERSLDDITMRLGSISWRMDEVRDGEGRLADRIDESALALAEAMFASRRERPDEDRFDAQGYDAQGYDAQGYDAQGYGARGFDAQSSEVQSSDARRFEAESSDARGFEAESSDAYRSYAGGPSDRAEFGAPLLDSTEHELPAADTTRDTQLDTEPDTTPDASSDAGNDTRSDTSGDAGSDQESDPRSDTARASGSDVGVDAAPRPPYPPDPEPERHDLFRAPGGDEGRRPDYTASEPDTSAGRDEAEGSLPRPAPESEDRPLADVVDLPSYGREPAAEQRPDEPTSDQPGDEVASGRPSWGPTGDFLGSRPPAASGAVQAAGSETVVFEFPTEGTAPSAAQSEARDPQQDFFDRWGPQPEEVPAPNAEPAPVESPVPDENRSAVRGLGGPRTGERFLREVSAARENQDATRPTEAVAVPDLRATDDTVPPEWFASYFRNEARSSGPKPVPKNGPSPAPLPGGRPAPGSA